MSDVSVVFVTVGKREEASRIGRALVDEKLVACANIIPGVLSVYRWKGEVCNDEECLMIMKTKTSLIPLLKDRILALHSYEVPEIVSFTIDQGLPPYLDWVRESTLSEQRESPGA